MVVQGESLTGTYADATVFELRWRELVARCGGRESIAARSIEGRPLWRFELGSRDPEAPAVLLTALVHGIELIGSVALLEAVARMALARSPALDRARLVVMPIANPDALAANMGRLASGRRAYQRCNARGVDLNRNFPIVPSAGALARWHPMAGSAHGWSPWFRGAAPLSEPEARAIHDAATELRPKLSLGFHSFGNLLLYPWAHSRAPNPRRPRYARLAEVFLRHLPDASYRFRQAIDWYPILGDMDDWLDATFGTVAYTVEVSGLDRRLLHPRALNPFWWMNPLDVDGAVSRVAPGVAGLIAGALDADHRSAAAAGDDAPSGVRL